MTHLRQVQQQIVENVSIFLKKNILATSKNWKKNCRLEMQFDTIMRGVRTIILKKIFQFEPKNINESLSYEDKNALFTKKFLDFVKL